MVSSHSPGGRLVDIYVAAAPEPARPALERDPLLPGRLRECLQVARAAWPTLDLPTAVFLPYLARRVAWLPDMADPIRAQVTDLYLACACQIGADVAVSLFEQAVFAELRLGLHRMRLSAEEVDEVLQRMRVELFVASPPLIGRYTGRGTLRRWAMAIARHDALKLLASRRREPVAPLDVSPEPADDRDDHELARGSAYAEYVADALRAAIEALPAEDRRLLRLQTVDGLSGDEIARRYNVHRATVARWLASIRAEIHDGARRGLKQSLDMGTNDVESVIRQGRQYIDLSLDRLLATSG